MFVSQGCCNKLPETGWHKAPYMYSLAVLEARSLKSRCQQDCAPSQDSRSGKNFTPVLWWLRAVLITHLSLCFSSHSVTFSSVYSPFL